MAIAVGSKVRYTPEEAFAEEGEWCAGLVGTVKFIYGGEMPYAVEFEVENEAGHTCGSSIMGTARTQDHHGWWASKRELEVVE